MFEKIDRHMRGDHISAAEKARLSHEAKWQVPSLEQIYWSNPNSQRGHVARCDYSGSIAPDMALYAESHYTEGN